MVMLLATLWYPDLNIIGAGSLVPAAFVFAHSLLVRWTGSRVLVAAAPMAFGLCTPLSPGFPLHFRVVPDADESVGYYLLMVTTAVYAFRVARFGTLLGLVYGAAFLFASSWLLAAEFGLRLSALIADDRSTRDAVSLAALAVWLIAFGLLIRFANAQRRQIQRTRLGLCVTCG